MFEIILNFVLLIASLAGLVLIADKLINHSVKLAGILGVSATVIGLTLLAYGTSMPELAVSSISAFTSHSELSISNITGSNMYNVAVIMGIVALLVPFTFKKVNMRRDGLFMLASTAALILLALVGGINIFTAALMVVLILSYTVYIIRNDRKKGGEGEKVKRIKGSAWKEFLWCCLLIIGVVVLGHLTVQFAVASARSAGVSEWLIGSTIVAAGTSMPETVVSIIAARKKQMGMSLGNIVGSNYFNVFWILGFSGLIGPLTFSLANIWVDMIFLSAICLLFFFALCRRKITRPEGILYLAIYALFIIYLLGLLPFIPAGA
jgi:cation:H+ antiporter